MRWGYRKGKGHRAVKVPDRRPSFTAEIHYASDYAQISQAAEQVCLFLKESAAADRRLRAFYVVGHRSVSPTCRERKFKKKKRHVFHWGKTTQVMDDNPSIVALSHILDWHIMRLCYCFLQLLWSGPNMTFVLCEYLVYASMVQNESDVR